MQTEFKLITYNTTYRVYIVPHLNTIDMSALYYQFIYVILLLGINSANAGFVMFLFIHLEVEAYNIKDNNFSA